MDFLTHLFLPLTVAYVLRPDLFISPATLSIGVAGLLPDFDKFLGVPGALHSLVSLAPICLVVLGTERWLRGRFRLSPVIVALVGSHLLLDLLDGGPVTLLFPLVETGFGLQYPVRTVFGEGPLGVTWKGPLVTLRTAPVRAGFSESGVATNTYGFIKGTGIASCLVFLSIYAGRRGWRGQAEHERVDASNETRASTERQVNE